MPENFKKEDFLTPRQAAKELGYDFAIVKKTMKQLRLKNATVMVQTGRGATSPRPVVCNSHTTYRLHPLGREILRHAIEANLLKEKE